MVGIGVITFALAEATVRAFRYLVPSALPSIIFYDQSYNRYRGKPGAPDYEFRLNSKGFKDVEFSVERQPGVRRVIALGDSFAFGAVPYHYNYLTLAEQRLNEGGVMAEVINMGIPGLAPQDYLSVFANEGLALKPDLVLVSFFIGNDFDETRRLRTRLHQFSDVLALAKYVVDARTKFAGNVYHVKPVYDDQEPYFRESSYLAVEKQRSWVYRKPPTYPQALSDGIRYLVEIKRLADQNGAEMMVLAMPDEFQVSPGLRQRVLGELGLTEAEIDLSQPNRFLAEELDRHGIQSVDLLDAFISRGREIPLYKPLDSHWNIAGNALAAEVLSDPLSRAIRSRGATERRNGQ